jgi:hypothetical protein
VDSVIAADTEKRRLMIAGTPGKELAGRFVEKTNFASLIKNEDCVVNFVEQRLEKFPLSACRSRGTCRLCHGVSDG